MIKCFLYIHVFLTFVTFIGCDNTNDTVTYFGGKIINPKTNFVLLYANGTIIDSISLNKNNTFSSKLKNINEGLYYFVHGHENQYLYLKPKDSLMLRLNTWDFDESIVFTGKGAERNNILIDCFLESEKNDKIFHSLNQLDSDSFYKKTDSLISLKQQTYQNYLHHHPDETSNFNQILKIALTYPIYAKMERYPIAHLKYSNNKKLHNFSPSFYQYRKFIDLKNDSLLYYPLYSLYIRNFLHNTTYALGYQPMKNEYTVDFTVDLLKVIDKKIGSKKIKNVFLKQTLISHFYKKSNGDINEKIFNTYFKLSTNTDDKKQIRQFLFDNKTLNKGQKIKDFLLTDINGQKYSIKKLTRNKKSVLFFWHSQYASSDYISSRINYLAKKFPKIHFFQIKINPNKEGEILKSNAKDLFFITPESNANQFLTSKMPRTIIINDKGFITNGYASIASTKIHTELKNLSKD